MSRWYGLNRTVCEVLGEMRTQLNGNLPINKPLLLSLVEETQVMVNRMEAALADLRDVEALHLEIKKLKGELNELESKKPTP